MTWPESGDERGHGKNFDGILPAVFWVFEDV
jgi:hypothetical protein